MTNAIDFLEKELSVAESKFKEAFYYPYRGTKDVLYHYTSTDGLLGIIKDHCLHLTNINYMNDYTELLYGINLVKEVINSIINNEKFPIDNEISAWLQEMNLQNGFLTNGLLDPDVTEVFITCFSVEPNQLSQWRGYGSQGQGYSIGFYRDNLNEKQADASLCKVVYEPDVQKELILNIFKLSIEALNNTKNSFKIDSNSLGELLKKLTCFISDLLIYPLVSFKDKGFIEEQEWRLVAIRYNDALEDFSQFKFKNSKGILTPYIELDCSDFGSSILPIKEIFCGPALKSELAKKYVGQLLRKYGYPNTIIVESSNIPYRPF